jgi:hypothetical protein
LAGRNRTCVSLSYFWTEKKSRYDADFRPLPQRIFDPALSGLGA